MQNFTGEISELIERTAGKEARVVPLAGDASGRKYFRIRGASRTYVLCVDSSFTGTSPEAYPFFIMTRLLCKHGIPVPEIVGHCEKSGAIMLSDGGDTHLIDMVKGKSRGEILSLYKRCIDISIRFQSVRGPGPVPFGLAFDREKLMYEFDFFMDHAVEGLFGETFRGGDKAHLREEFMKISALLDMPEKFVLNHRDYHSKNILFNEDKVLLIDYQDARMGLPQYDAASLLRDSYLVLEDSLFEECLAYCREKSREAGLHLMGTDEYRHFFDISAFQRNIKAVGTFGYQSSVKNKKDYEQYIPPTLAYCREYAARRPEVSRAWKIVDRYSEAYLNSVKGRGE